MLLLKFIKITLIAFSKIPYQAKNFKGNYFVNCLKLIIDQIIRTVGSIWHYLFKNRNDVGIPCMYDFKIF